MSIHPCGRVQGGTPLRVPEGPAGGCTLTTGLHSYDEMLTLLGRLDTHAQVRTDKWRAWSLLDTLREGGCDERDCVVALNRTSRFDVSEPTVIAELMDKCHILHSFVKRIILYHHMLSPNTASCD